MVMSAPWLTPPPYSRRARLPRRAENPPAASASTRNRAHHNTTFRGPATPPPTLRTNCPRPDIFILQGAPSAP